MNIPDYASIFHDFNDDEATGVSSGLTFRIGSELINGDYKLSWHYKDDVRKAGWCPR